MIYETQPEPSEEIKLEPSEDEIRVRSYLIWEREGRPEGRSQEHWTRAKAELEIEMEEASFGGENTELVMPRLPISLPPQRSLAVRIETDRDPVAAVAGKK